MTHFPKMFSGTLVYVTLWSNAQAVIKSWHKGGTRVLRGRMEEERHCTYAKGEPASSLRSQPGRKEGEEWVEDGTGVVGWLFVDEMSRGKWVKSTDEYAQRQQGKPGHIVQYNRHLSLAALVSNLNKSCFLIISSSGKTVGSPSLQKKNTTCSQVLQDSFVRYT